MKTNELTGAALDWAVAKCEQPEWWDNFPDEMAKGNLDMDGEGTYSPSTDWSQGGPIIERENIALRGTWDGETAGWITMKGRVEQTGPTPLTAAMRCYVASKLGDEVEIPEELV